MSRFRSELRVIPIAPWIVASLIMLACFVVIGAIAFRKIGLEFIPISFILPVFAVYVLLVGYVYGDARRRGMRYVVWTLLAIFVPNGIGIILYFLFREQISRPCPSCGNGYKPGAAYCPHCGAAVGRFCPQCKCTVEESWNNCAHCGTPVPV